MGFAPRDPLGLAEAGRAGLGLAAATSASRVVEGVVVIVTPAAFAFLSSIVEPVLQGNKGGGKGGHYLWAVQGKSGSYMSGRERGSE